MRSAYCALRTVRLVFAFTPGNQGMPYLGGELDEIESVDWRNREMDRIEEVRAAAEEYGRRSVENMNLGRKLGTEILEAFDKYLSSAGGLVIGVPPSGEWRTNGGCYGDAAFSYFYDGVLSVRDTTFGVAVTIFKDTLWVRMIVKLQKQGDRIGVFVDDGKAVWLPTTYSAQDLERACERLLRTLVGHYQGDVNAFVHGDERRLTIGFRGNTNKPLSP